MATNAQNFSYYFTLAILLFMLVLLTVAAIYGFSRDFSLWWLLGAALLFAAYIVYFVIPRRK